LKKTIKKALENVFIKGLGFFAPETRKIHSDLWKLAKQWYSAHLKDNEPILEQNEAISIIKAKEVS
jgi:hypothetical protein